MAWRLPLPGSCATGEPGSLHRLRTSSPSTSISGMRPVIRSATMRAVPQAIVQPM